MTDILDQFRTELRERRGALAVERDRISGEIEQLARRRAELDQVLEQIEALSGSPRRQAVQTGGEVRRPKQPTGTSPYAEREAEKALLRQTILGHLRVVHPGGLSSSELRTRVQSDLAMGGLSLHRISSNCKALSTEILGDGVSWFFIPVEPTEGLEGAQHQ